MVELHSFETNLYHHININPAFLCLAAGKMFLYVQADVLFRIHVNEMLPYFDRVVWPRSRSGLSRNVLRDWAGYRSDRIWIRPYSFPFSYYFTFFGYTKLNLAPFWNEDLWDLSHNTFLLSSINLYRKKNFAYKAHNSNKFSIIFSCILSSV